MNAIKSNPWKQFMVFMDKVQKNLTQGWIKNKIKNNAKSDSEHYFL